MYEMLRFITLSSCSFYRLVQSVGNNASQKPIKTLFMSSRPFLLSVPVADKLILPGMNSGQILPIIEIQLSGSILIPFGLDIPMIAEAVA